MVNLKIDRIDVSVPEGTTIKEAAVLAGVDIPTLCYLKEINEIGACRVCTVELVGKKKLVPACNTPVQEGMEVLTNSPKVRRMRETNIRLILSQHDSRCAICIRSGNCNLQTIANDLGIMSKPYPDYWKTAKWNPDFPLIRNEEKCIRCMRCIQICDKVQSLSVWDIINTGAQSTVGVAGSGDIEKAPCSLCGQCITHCPVAALHTRQDYKKLLAAMEDPEKVTVVQVAPAVRTAWAEALGIPLEVATPGRMVAALKRMGFDYVLDTTWSADLTIMEEGSELLERLPEIRESGKPMFTSCCPGWVRFLKSQYPDMVDQLSTSKSPQQMFGSVVKTYFAEKIGVDPSKIYSVSIMPCVAKKAEAALPPMTDSGYADVDCVMTTREMSRMVRLDRLAVEKLPEMNFDNLMGQSSGAGVIFGATGGVMEAALRSAYYLLNKKNPDPDSFRTVRGPECDVREAEFNMGGAVVKVAAVSGLGNTRRLIERLRRGEVQYDFVEVMACPGGCVGGGGQPIHDGTEMAAVRGANLYELDRKNSLRFSHENPEVLHLYSEYMEAPMSEKAHHLLHTDHHAWKMPGE